MNRYSYAHGDPVHWADPSGRFSVGEAGVAGNIQATLGSLQADFGFNMVGSALNSDSAPGVDDVAFGMLAVLAPQAKMVAKLSKKPKQLTLGRSAKSTVLGYNLRVMGKAPGSATDQAHHIVAGKAAGAADARAILNRHGIDINSPANGVWLPRSSHCGWHCGNYCREVNRALLAADQACEKPAVMAAPKDLERQLIAGEIRVHRQK